MNGSRVVPYDELAADGSKETAASLWRLLTEFARAIVRDDPIAHRYLLLLQFILANAIALALVGAAAGQGWIGVILAADQGGLCRAIVGVFLVGAVWSGRRALELSRGLNELEQFASGPGAPAPAYIAAVAGRAGDTRAILASSLRLKLASRITPIRHLANSLVLLGLIGTVVGFIMALAGVNPETSADAASIGPMVSTLISGMSVALYTTLIGAVLNIWLMVNFQILVTGTVNLMTGIVELGEIHAR
jgi:hypothetical protein